MAQFNLEDALALIPIYNGSNEQMNSFIRSIRFAKKMFSADQESILVEFIYTRLTGKAESGIISNLSTVEEIVKDIRSRCEKKIDLGNIISDMKALKSKNLKTLCNEIEELTEKLKVSYIQKNIPADVANELALRKGVETLIEKILK